MKIEKLHEFPRQNHHVFVRILYLHSNSIRTFDEREFCRDVGYVGERSRWMMSKAGSEFVSISIVKIFDARFGQLVCHNTERTGPVNFISVVDIVPSVVIGKFRLASFVITLETNSFRLFGDVSRDLVVRIKDRGTVQQQPQLKMISLLQRNCRMTIDFPYSKGIGLPSSLFIAISIVWNS
jgi:hypothetical protein